MDEPIHHPKTDRITIALRLITATIGILIVLGALWVGYTYAISPEAIRHPRQTHYHFRLQIINNGTPINFAASKFQTEFNKDNCSAALTKEPIHFHDARDQFVHIHWKHMTGGLVLKHYGWNFIGGPDDALGTRFDQVPRLMTVPIHGHALPAPPAGTHYYVYVGDHKAYHERSWNDFLHQDLQDFFSSKSATKQTWFHYLVPVAFAHGDEDALSKLNDLQGNVVIFAQKDRPTENQIKDRFNQLVPLPQSSCAG